MTENNIQGLIAGKAEQEYPQYGLSLVPLLYASGQGTGFKAVVRNNAIIAIPKSRYKLLPNEIAISVAEESSKLVGAVPFSEFSGDWYMKLDKHIIANASRHNREHEATQIHALYAFNKPVEIRPGDKVQLGFGIHNSIDGTMGFGAGVFTFRHACSNMVFMGFKGYEMAFDDRKTMAYIYSKHTNSLTIDKELLKGLLIELISKAQDVVNTYRKMATMNINEEIARRLVASKMLPAKFLPEEITLDEEKREFKSLTSTPNLWTAYNQVTGNIWHNAKTDLQSKRLQFNALHKAILPPVTGRRI